MTASGLIVYACAMFIPEEHLVWCPQLLLDAVIANIHYAPLEWHGEEKDNVFSIHFDIKETFM